MKLLMIRTLIREDCCDGNDLDLDQTMMEIMRLKIMMILHGAEFEVGQRQETDKTVTL